MFLNVLLFTYSLFKTHLLKILRVHFQAPFIFIPVNNFQTFLFVASNFL